MKLRRVRAAGFRAFAEGVEIDLDADVVILFGENGQGKTSVFDAIHWALVGRLSRLRENPAAMVSMYSDIGEASVTLELADDAGKELVVTRTSDGDEQRLRIVRNSSQYQGQKAEVEMLEELWPSALLTTDGIASLEAAITKSVYLQQDVLRDFIEADSEQDRFNAVSELIGAGRITELQVQLERAKKAWSAVTNRKREELADLSMRVSSLGDQLQAMSQGSELSASDIEDNWRAWSERYASAVGDAEGFALPSSPTAPIAASALDVAVRRIDSAKRSLSRRAEGIRVLLSELSARETTETPDVAGVSERLTSVLNTIQAKSTELLAARARLEEERAQMRDSREAREELRTLAQIALRHLGEKCPVCTQEYNHAVTTAHLRRLAEGEEAGEGTPLSLRVVDDIEAELDALSRTKTTLETQVESTRRRGVELEEWQRQIRYRAEELGIERLEDMGLKDALEDGAVRTARELDALIILGSEGEVLASNIAKIADVARRREIAQEIERLTPQIKGVGSEISRRDSTGDAAGRMIEALRGAGSSIVQTQMNEIEPLLQRVYSRIDPHPTLRSVRLLSTYSYGRGHLAAEVGDPIAQVSSRAPQLVFSSSQLNALAVSVFLAFNLGMPSVPLQCAMLDDPFQTLDDINLLGLVDLLRRFSSTRQLLISTHDSRFASLLQRKLRPLSEDKRTTVIELQGWSRRGPKVSQVDMPVDREPFKIAA
jgi:exonuclease SbcC